MIANVEIKKPSPLAPVKGRLAWRIFRGTVQLLALFAMILSPLAGGWQRTDASSLSAWGKDAYDLPIGVANALPSASEGKKYLPNKVLVAGGTGVRIADIPLIDPVVGTAALFRAAFNWQLLLGLLFPLLAALLAGRIFCGWFCPFGTLSRWLDALRSRLPFHPIEVGDRRWLRFVILFVAGLASAMGFQVLAVYAIPYLLLQHSIYSMWLLGGGGAALGWVLGLFAAGLFLGPTAYCTTLCPTGALLSIFGRFRPIKLRIVDPVECGPTCHNCDLQCWLSLHPSTGDAGADCDNCARCFTACPKDNLRIGLGTGLPRERRMGKVLPVVTSLAFIFLLGSNASAGEPIMRPMLIIDEVREVDETSVAVGVLNLSEQRMNLYSEVAVGGSEITLRLTRGEREKDDYMGRMGPKEHYKGELTVEVLREGKVVESFSLEKPNAPKSTAKRKLYFEHVETELVVGDQIRIPSVKGWTNSEVVFSATEARAGADKNEPWMFFLASLLFHVGAISLAIAYAQPKEAI
ncbi:MAG: 4Fe-4S binding protein [Deltaproteobacteria bacterium]|nr:4Fe-4S binding protein [Deltaproteobacteria bacterium]